MKRLDCLGDICPIPLIKLKKEVPSIRMGETVLLITDHSCTYRSVKEYCDETGLYCVASEVLNGVWEVLIRQQQSRS